MQSTRSQPRKCHGDVQRALRERGQETADKVSIVDIRCDIIAAQYRLGRAAIESLRKVWIGSYFSGCRVAYYRLRPINDGVGESNRAADLV